MGETYYEILGVDSDATQDEIQAAYRDRVLETHPDHNDDPDAAEQFKRVSTAESVLTDEAERARYDRLGHESYMRFATYSGDADSESTDSNDDRSAASESRTNTSGTRTDEGTGETNGGRRRRGSGRRSRTAGDGGGYSHHARHRYHRQQRTERQRAEDGWPFDGSQTESGATRTSTTGTHAGETGQATAGTQDDRQARFSYAVHGWDDEIEVGPNERPIHQSTIINLISISLVYPLLVYGTVSPGISLAANVIVACCTLVLVAYMLTFPRAAVSTFGTWSILIPAGLVVGPFDPLSFYGLLAIGCCWIPFGYALAVWWVLRP